MAETTIDAYVTMYGFPDNDPPFSANIAHPVLHQQASGIGTFDDPITFAGDPGDIPFGTKIYVPHVQKYFIMEDTCADAMASPNDRLQVDLWAGGSANTDVQQLLSVENANTRSSAPVILNADPGHPVNLTPFDGSPTPSTPAQTPASAATADPVSELLANIPAQDPSAKASDPVSAPTGQTITGTGYADNLMGGAGNDTIHGAGGRDTITGAGGDDHLWGGTGSDTFVFKAGFGHDIIGDFRAGSSSGHDYIDFGSDVFSSFSAVMSHTADTPDGALITYDDGNSVLLSHVQKSSLVAGDFHFF